MSALNVQRNIYIFVQLKMNLQELKNIIEWVEKKTMEALENMFYGWENVRLNYMDT